MEDGSDKSKAKRKKAFEHEKGMRRKKRAPPKPVKKENTILVHRKTEFKAQLEKCQRLLDKGMEELEIHGLGAAINQAINIALQLEVRGKGSLKLKTTTATVNLIDDYEAIADEIDPHSKTRSCSAVKITISRNSSEKIDAKKDKVK